MNKTKTELLDEIKELKKEVERLDRFKQYEETATEVTAITKAFENSGYTREEAFQMTLEMVRCVAKKMF